jgi:hypothetical protein
MDREFPNLSEMERTYKARLVMSAKNSFEAAQFVEKLVNLANKEGLHILVDDIEELIY